jgi:hypothetical protein
MAPKKYTAILVTILLIPALACNFSGAVPTQDPAAATAAIQTQVALIVALTSAAETPLATDTLAETATALPSETPQFTFTPSSTDTLIPTATPSLTLTPGMPKLSVSMQTNCRSGPGDGYDILGVLQVGQVADVVGRSSNSTYWVVSLPTQIVITCWLWGQYASVTGNTQNLPVVAAPPTPTPAAGFEVSYVGWVTCTGEYALTFKISNPGSVTWESVEIVEKDKDTSTTRTHTRDSFKRYNNCNAVGEDLNLEPGETGYSTAADPGQFSYSLAGHEIRATITVCSKDALKGICLSKTLTFNA